MIMEDPRDFDLVDGDYVDLPDSDRFDEDPEPEWPEDIEDRPGQTEEAWLNQVAREVY